MNWTKKYALGLIYFMDKITRNIPSHILRDAMYRYFWKVKIGNKVAIYSGVEMRSQWKIEIGSNSVIGHNCLLDGRRGLKIGNNVNISSGVWIWTLQHDVNDPDFTAVGAEVSIDDKVWICSRATILPGVKIGEGAVVAAGSVVTKSIPPFAIVGGVPAKVIGQRTRDLRYELDFKIPFV